MSDMLALHRAARDSVLTYVHEFRSAYKRGARVVYAFFEGKQDPSYYLNAVQMFLPDQWRIRRWCVGKKENVYAVHAVLDWTAHEETSVLFFVDRDLSDVLGQSWPEALNIYVTDHYSIENAVVSAQTLQRGLEEVCGLVNASHSEMEAVLGSFERVLAEFCRAVSVVMAWYVLCRRHNLRPCLDNIRMSDLFSLGEDALVQKVGDGVRPVVEYCESQCSTHCPSANDNELISIASELGSAVPGHRHIRGKYLLWLLVEFSDYTCARWRAQFPTMTAAPKKTIQLGLGNAMAVLGPRVVFPSTLRIFLDRTVVAYVASVQAA